MAQVDNSLIALAIIYTTAPDLNSAQAMAKTLVEERLVSCVNIIPSIVSVYRWEGAVQSNNELSMILKTRADWVERVVARLADIHQYSTPAILSVAVDFCQLEYNNWLLAQLLPDASVTK